MELWSHLLLKALMKVHNVVLFQLSEHLDLSHGGFLHDLIVITLLKLLDGNCK